MVLAEKILSENVAEYVVYMYHIEDVMRAFNFDVEKILKQYIEPQLPDKSFLGTYSEWLTKISEQMRNEKIEISGHLSSTISIIEELNYLHSLLLDVLKEQKYKDLYERTLPIIEEFSVKSEMIGRNPIEIAFHSQYMKLLMKLKKDSISGETEMAFDQMRTFLAYLSARYKQMREQN